MSCDSWIFVHKHISDAEDGNGRVIERKVLWNENSWEIGQMFTDKFYLPNGTYRSVSPEALVEFAEDCLAHPDAAQDPYTSSAFMEMKESLNDPDPRDNYFVSVDW